MIYTGIEEIDMSLIQLGSDRINKVCVGDTQVWPRLKASDLDANGHDYVDMGEAGIWATCNVGASKPEEFGQYFAFADSKGYYANQIGSGKHTFFGRDYKWKKIAGSWVDGYTLAAVTKYNWMYGRSTIDNRLIVEPEDDGAHVNLGGDWRIPASFEFEKLRDLCDIQETTLNGVRGYKYTLKSDSSKSIFLPNAGYALGYRAGEISSAAIYAISDKFNDVVQGLCLPYFGDDPLYIANDRKCMGLPIRPILAKPIDTSLLNSEVLLKVAGDGTVGLIWECGYDTISNVYIRHYYSTLYARPNHQNTKFNGFYKGDVKLEHKTYESQDDMVRYYSDIESPGLYVALFEEYTRKITIKTSENGNVEWGELLDNDDPEYELSKDAEKSRNVAVNSIVSIGAIPDENYNFKEWQNNLGEVVSTENPYSFQMPDDDVSYTAIFEIINKKYNVLLKLGNNCASGTYSINNGEISGDLTSDGVSVLITEGSKIEYTAIAKDGYIFENGQTIISKVWTDYSNDSITEFVTESAISADTTIDIIISSSELIDDGLKLTLQCSKGDVGGTFSLQNQYIYEEAFSIPLKGTNYIALSCLLNSNVKDNYVWKISDWSAITNFDNIDKEFTFDTNDRFNFEILTTLPYIYIDIIKKK